MTDSAWRWVTPRSVLAGSPLKLFTVSDPGEAFLRSIEHGTRDARTDTSPAERALLERFLDAGAIHPVALDLEASSSSGSPHAPGPSVADVTVVTPQLGGEVVADGRVTVDDASDPPLAGAALRLDSNLGPGGARNAGRSVVTTPFIAFVDADVDVPELDPGHRGHQAWWATLLAHFSDSRVGLVAPRVVGDPDSSLDLGEQPARIRAGTRVSYVPAAAIVVRSAAFDDVGGFDAALRAGEDVDFVWRLDQAGWWCRYEPGVSVRHRPRDTWRGRIEQQVLYGSSSGPLSLRHPTALAPWRSTIEVAAPWLLAAAGRPVISALVAGAALARRLSRSSSLGVEVLARLVAHGHLAAIEQASIAVRRAWWPLLVPFVCSRRVRRLLALSFAVAPRRAVLDVAFSVGVWRSVLATRDLGAIRPRLSRGTL